MILYSLETHTQYPSEICSCTQSENWFYGIFIKTGVKKINTVLLRQFQQYPRISFFSED